MRLVVAMALVAIPMVSIGQGAQAADPAVVKASAEPLKAKPVDPPFFFVNDNRLTYSFLFSGTDPGIYSRRPDGTINGKTQMSLYSFTHFDAWAYGSNFFSISLAKSGHNDPASPCLNVGVLANGALADCAGATTVFGQIRSTLGFKELFGLSSLGVDSLRNISLLVGLDAATANTLLAPAKKDVVAGLQFQFGLPYKGYFNIAPLYYKEWNHTALAQCGFFGPGVPGVTCLSDGNTDFSGTWAVETNYYMDLSFLPPGMDFFSISGRAAWYGPKGTDKSPLPYNAVSNVQKAIEFNSEPIRLTFDASKAVWGPKYSHSLDLWVAYRYWQNKQGFDHIKSSICTVGPGGVSNNSCTESSLYVGASAKF